MRKTWWLALFILGLGLVFGSDGVVLATETTSGSADTSAMSPGTTDTGTGAALPAPDPQTTCTQGGGKWCRDASASGWCSYSTSPCPAYDEPSCQAQSGEWCKYASPMPGTIMTGWCATPPSSCPVNDEASCTAKARTWCKSQYGNGWCANTGEKCPANDAPSCQAQGGEWCVGIPATAAGWCATLPSSCPINDATACAAKGRSWCKYTSTMSSGGVSGWCANTGEKCPGDSETVPTPTPTPTPEPTPVWSWPQTESECKLYNGKWCVSSGAAVPAATGANYGYCTNGNRNCPVPVPADKMTCWDNSIVPTNSSCPSMPTTQTECTKLGKNWCQSGTSAAVFTSGWCSAEVCMVFPPAGQMSCPDGVSFAKVLTSCPKVPGEILPPPPDPLKEKICPDGTKVAGTMDCPVGPAEKICLGGQKVSVGNDCPDENVTLCLGKGGIWCADSAGLTKGQCSLVGSCALIQTTTTIDKGKPSPEGPLTEQQVKMAERGRRTLILQLNNLERFFKRVKDQEALDKVGALRVKIQALPADAAIFDNLEAARGEVEILRELKEDAEAEGQVKDEGERDQRLQKIALDRLQREARRFDTGLKVLGRRLTRLEQGGVTIPEELRTATAKASALIKTIKSADSLDEAQEAMDELQSVAELMNEYLPRLEQHYRLQRVLPLTEREVKRLKGELAAVKNLTKRLGEIVVGELEALAEKLTVISAAIKEAKSGDFGEQEPVEFLKSQILEPLEEVDEGLSVLRASVNLRQSVKGLESRWRRAEARITRLEKTARKKLAAERELVVEVKEQVANLKTALGAKLTADSLPEVLEQLAIATDKMNDLERLLGIRPRTLIELELGRKLRIEEAVPLFKVPELEKVSVAAYRIATFLRRSPGQLVGLQFLRLFKPELNADPRQLVSY